MSAIIGARVIVKALLRLYQGSIKALKALFLKALLRLSYGSRISKVFAILGARAHNEFIN
jgi:hypothetical protein